MMMSMTCHNLEFGRTGLDLVACGCSSNASINRFLARNQAKRVLRSVNGAGYGPRKLLCCRRNIARCRVVSTKNPETLLDGIPSNFFQFLVESNLILHFLSLSLKA